MMFKLYFKVAGCFFRAGLFRFLLALWLAGFLPFARAQSSSSSPASHKIQVSDAALAKQIEGAGGKLIANYGSYKLYETTNLPAELTNSSRAELRDDYNFITLHAGHLDTRLSAVKALRKSAGDFSGKQLHLVQFAGPVQPQWREELLNAGAQIVNYIPENSYLIYADAAALAQVQALAAAPRIQWDGPYRAEYKIHPRAQTTDAQGNARVIGTDLFDIQLVADDAANPATLQLLDRLKLEPLKRQDRVNQYLNVVARLDANDLKTIAAQPDVIFILPFFPRQKVCERQDEIIAGNLTGGIPNGPGYLAWLRGLGFNESQFTNILVDVSDSGIDNGTTAPGHFGLYVDGLNANASRVIYNRLEGTANSGSTLQGCDGHGNLNSHIVCGYDDYSGFPFQDAGGYHYGLGVCPFVSVGSSVIFDPTSYTYPNFPNLQSQAYHSGARVSNNSWGETGSDGVYDSEAQTYDSLVRDAEPFGSTYSVSGNQEMVIVFAAGNGGPSAETISSPGSAKNVITVGAADSVQPYGGGTDNSGLSDEYATNANNIAFFSSAGPCADGRAKPDLVAPGVHISGGVFQATNNFTVYPDGIAGACFTGAGVSGGPDGSLFWPTNQEFYTASDGTSHSTPCVSGACALTLQYFQNNFNSFPSPAMTKAYLMNSTRYLTGVYANDTLPSAYQGMGELDLGTAFDGTPRILRDQLDLLTNSGQAKTFYGTINNPNLPFCVTLAWTDAPGATSGNAYDNNLDLTVTLGTNVYKGNVFSGAYSVTGGTADAKNNVESVFLPAGTAGNFSVTVNGTSINSIGVPNSANIICQDFALVIYNATQIYLPQISGVSAALLSENCLPTNGVIDPGETVTVNFTLQNTGSGPTTNLTATLLPSGNIISPSGPKNYGALAANGGTNAQPFTFQAAGTCGVPITATFQLQDGTNNYGNVSFTLPLGRLVAFTNVLQNFDAVTAPALPAGWSTDATGAESPWTTSTGASDTAPNAAFASGPASIGLAELISPAIAINSASAEIVFRNNYNLQYAGHGTTAYDGGVLEVQIGTNAYADIVTAGGSFVTGGYNKVISSSRGNPLAGRSAWSGSSGGFITTTARLPAAAAGQTVNFKWRCGTDDSTSSVGWYIDTVSIIDASYQCCDDNADLAVGLGVSPNPNAALVGSNLNYTLSLTNLGPALAAGVTVTDSPPAGANFVSATPGYAASGGNLIWNLGSLAAGATNVLSVTVIPTTTNLLTNIFSAASTTSEVNYANNSVTNIISALQAVSLTSQPVSQIVAVGSNAIFQVTATGSSPLVYQWLFNASPIIGATNYSFAITNAPTNQSGGYSVIVTNPVNAVTSTVAALTVVAPPLLTQALGNQTALVGTNVTFAVGVAGQLLTYQWLFNGSNALADTTNSLTLTNAQPAQAGTYTVTITNVAGAVSSSAQLSLVLPPLTISVTAGNVQVSLNSRAGLNYTLQYKNSLSISNWTSLAPAVPGTGAVITLTDPAPATGNRFYRVTAD